VTAKDPKGPWSNPVALPEVNGIDPSLFFDDNDKAYIIYNSIPPNNETMWGGHRTIRMYQFDAENLKIKGEQILLVNGGTDVTKKPVWIEGPHIYKINDWYYLMCAQGGTGYNHTEVVFRSKNVYGPYWPYEKNPILTQMHLDPSRPDPITTTGHADLVEDNEGNWWGVFLGCRPYEGDFYNTGRETFMAPVKWTTDGWPVFDLGGDEVKYQYPINATKNTSLQPFNGNYTFKDDFDGDKLNLRYRFLRTVKDSWYSLSENKGTLVIQLRKETVAGRSNPSFVGFSQPHLKGHAATALKFSPKSPNEKAGLIAMQNETHFYYLAQSVKNGKSVIELFKDSSVIASKKITIKKNKDLYLKIVANNDKYSFYYATQENKWQLLFADADGKYLSTKGAGGFVGTLYGMYATSDGVSSDTKAVYDWFEISNDDDVYKK
ncbi:MAG: family 43 glycosylhydrolase, partial [Chitinophagaceae bacterium]|nr:family 43 glycosylhydrolase [Chitinophagaceae bacterium]